MYAEQQRALAQNVVRQAGVSLEELPLELLAGGQAYLPLISDEQYARSLSQPDGELKHLPQTESREILEEQIRRHRTASGTLAAKVDKTVTRAWGGLSVVAYRFTMPIADDEYRHFVGVVDELNGTDTEWRPLYAKAILAVMPMGDKRAGLLAKAFKAARPDEVLLTGAQVVPAADLNRPFLEPAEV